MLKDDIAQFITTLHTLEQRLDALTIATGQMPQPTDYQARAELATYVRELNLTASGWQTQSELLLQLLSDHPAQMEAASPVITPVDHVTTTLLDSKYKRIGIQTPWGHLRPVAYMHDGVPRELQRKSFREVYRGVLQSFADAHGEGLIDACRRAATRIPMTTDRNTYHHATAEHHGYVFNVQLPADNIRTNISSLYDVFGIPVARFAVWV